jgi:hypothetical protein
MSPALTSFWTKTPSPCGLINDFWTNRGTRLSTRSGMVGGGFGGLGGRIVTGPPPPGSRMSSPFPSSRSPGSRFRRDIIIYYRSDADGGVANVMIEETASRKASRQQSISSSDS